MVETMSAAGARTAASYVFTGKSACRTARMVLTCISSRPLESQSLTCASVPGSGARARLGRPRLGRPPGASAAGCRAGAEDTLRWLAALHLPLRAGQ
jgi:hypothetical protein